MKSRKEKREKGKGLWNEFKTFISRGNVVDMAVGVIMGSAFGAIVTAVTNILLSICTWGVPGGISGLVTVLPAVNEAQKGIEGIGQYFAASDIAAKTITYAASQGVTIDASSETFIQWQNALLGKYTLHGSTYTYNMSAVIDWGTFINAVISFLIIAITLFTIVKIYNTLRDRAKKAEADLTAKIESSLDKKEKVESSEEGTKEDKEENKPAE